MRNRAASVPPSSVAQYQKFELTYPCPDCLTKYSNPNDPQIVSVIATFTSSSGKQTQVPGFFFQDFTRSGDVTKETLTPVSGSDSWKVRFAPTEVGNYAYSVTVTDNTTSQPTPTVLGSGTFSVTASSNPGFIRATKYHLVRDNGQQFIPLGINAPWFKYAQNSNNTWGDGTYGVDKMYQMFVENGVNFFHLWTCSWNDGVEAPFAKPNIGCDSSTTSIPQMSQPDSWELDYMVDQAEQKGIYLMPILKHKDQQNWTHADEIKSRYFVARWGYSTSIVAWDLNKEGGTNTTVNSTWTAFMNSLDPYQHLRTTSQWNHFPTLSTTRQQNYNTIFSDPNMTLVQTHDYTADCNNIRSNDPGFDLFMMKYSPSDPRNFTNFSKPSFFGETGVHGVDPSVTPCTDQDSSGPSPLYDNDSQGLILKSEIWGSLMSSAGAMAPWMFRFDPAGAWTQFTAFKGASAYAQALPTIPDDAILFTSYNDSSQATTSDSRIRVIGRKTSKFAMLYVQNITGAPLKVLRGQTAIPLTGTIVLKNMDATKSYTVTWYDTTTGALIKKTPRNGATNFTLTLPQPLSQNIAAIVN